MFASSDNLPNISSNENVIKMHTDLSNLKL